MTMLQVERKRVIYEAVKIILIGLTTVLVIAALIIIAVQQHTVADLGKDTKINSDTLVDCTTPGHACYERGRSATSGAIGTINKVTILAVACAKLPQNDTLLKIQNCVTEGLK